MKKRTMVRLLAVFTVLALIGGLLAGCGSQSAKPAVKEVKIGTIYPMTGAAAVTGVELMNGVNLAIAIANGEYPDLDLPLAGEWDGEVTAIGTEVVHQSQHRFVLP